MTDFLDCLRPSTEHVDAHADDANDLFSDMCMECFCSSDDSECDWHWAFRKLVANLYQAALLCKAHEIAFRNACSWTRSDADYWWPGCGRTAP